MAVNAGFLMCLKFPYLICLDCEGNLAIGILYKCEHTLLILYSECIVYWSSQRVSGSKICR